VKGCAGDLPKERKWVSSLRQQRPPSPRKNGNGLVHSVNNVPHLQRALQLKPDYADARNGLVQASRSPSRKGTRRDRVRAASTAYRLGSQRPGPISSADEVVGRTAQPPLNRMQVRSENSALVQEWEESAYPREWDEWGEEQSQHPCPCP
jgi:hypothetical protein